MNKEYIKPEVFTQELSASLMLSVSADTGSYDTLPGQDDVIFDAPAKSWSSESWSDED